MMMHILKYIHRSFVGFLLVLFATQAFAQVSDFDTKIMNYYKREYNSGLQYTLNREREELRTSDTWEYEENRNNTAKLFFNSAQWKFSEYIQEQIAVNWELGTVWGNGSLEDSTAVRHISADHRKFGFRTTLEADYATRYYYNLKNYTLIQVYGWAQYDWYNQKTSGSSKDSNLVVTEHEHSGEKDKLRYGFSAKAGWGFGRLNPVNNYMVAEYLMNKFYPGRNFSAEEISLIAQEIHRIKSGRVASVTNDTEAEAQVLNDFLNNRLLLSRSQELMHDWQYGEFVPRYEGRRVELGPFFRYFNREPDFVYGGFVQFEDHKYVSNKLNRILKASLNYNGYKRNDWIMSTVDLGWSYYANLQSRFDIGMRYVPGTNVDQFKDLSSINHGFIPYIGYYKQLNQKARINLNLAYRISENKKAMLPGPEFSLSVYRSRY